MTESDVASRAVRNWLAIEQLALGELTTSEAAALRARLVAEGHDPDALLAQVEASNVAILASHPPSRAAAVITRRLGDAKPQRSRWWAFAPMVAVTAIVLLLIRIPGEPTEVVEDVPSVEIDSQGHGQPDDGILLKGAESRLVIHRQTAAGPERLHDGQVVAEGDVLQVSYIAAGARQGVIVSIDGRAVATQHFPPPAEAGTNTLEQGGAIPLATAYELDDAPQFERFFFVTSDDATPVQADVVFQAATTLAASGDEMALLPLPANLSQHVVLLRKAGQAVGSTL
ncbi:MAG: hypothetical protein ACPG4T_12310 [Nannocystaceae bacterium]